MAYIEEVSKEEADPTTSDWEVFVSTQVDHSHDWEQDLPSNVMKGLGRSRNTS